MKESAASQVIDDKKSLSERLQLFSKIVSDQQEYSRDLESMARATLAAPVSLRQHDILEYLAAHTMKNLGKEVTQVQAESTSVVTAAVRGSPKAAAQNLGVTSTRSAPDFDLRKRASDELARMRDKDPKRYQNLKQSYLETLEIDRKQIIFEMKERMQPSAFDDHLRYSLVKYMVENPSVWTLDDSGMSRSF
jgi:hypothetical protein